MTARVPQRTVYIDTNVFISAFESDPITRDHASAVLEIVAARKLNALTSIVTLAELLPEPLRLSQFELAAFYKEFISSRGVVDVVPVTRAMLVASAEARAQHQSLRLPDAIHVATALNRNCDAILSDDRRLASQRSIPVIPLGPHTLDDLRRLAA